MSDGFNDLIGLSFLKGKHSKPDGERPVEPGKYDEPSGDDYLTQALLGGWDALKGMFGPAPGPSIEAHHEPGIANPFGDLWDSITGPAQAYAAGHAPTREQNLHAVRGAATAIPQIAALRGGEKAVPEVQRAMRASEANRVATFGEAPAAETNAQRFGFDIDERRGAEAIPPPPAPEPIAPPQKLLPAAPAPKLLTAGEPQQPIAPKPTKSPKPVKPTAPAPAEPEREAGKWYYDNINESLKSWQNKGTADQLLAHLSKNKGALEEADAIGMRDWLKEHKNVTRDEVQQFLNANKIELQEINRGALSPSERTRLEQLDARVRTSQDDSRKLASMDGDRQKILNSIEALNEHIIQNTGWDNRPMTAESRNQMGRMRDEHEQMLEAYDKAHTQVENSLTPAEQKEYADLINRENYPHEYSPTSWGPNTHPELSLPGGENYREMRLALPEPYTPEYKAAMGDVEAARRKYLGASDELQNYQNEEFRPSDDQRYQELYERWQDSQKQLELAENAARAKRPERYIGGHWSTPDVLAHVRMNDRKLPDGRKVLFLEELQSDWGHDAHMVGIKNPAAERAAQEAYKQAQDNLTQFTAKYAKEENEKRLQAVDQNRLKVLMQHIAESQDKAKKLKKEFLAAVPADGSYNAGATRLNSEWLEAERNADNYKLQLQLFLNTASPEVGNYEASAYSHMQKMLDKHSTTTPEGMGYWQTSQKWNKLHEEIDRARETYSKSRKGVPDAPFINKGDGWKRLALKRMLTYAADNGYDGVGWTTGDMQNKRYSLSKHVEHIGWGMRPASRYGEGVRRVEVYLPQRDSIVMEVGPDSVVRGVSYNAYQQFVGKKLGEIVGKEVSEKIMGEEDGRLEGEGLDIGGEGKRNLYDKEFPNLADDILKKHGVKVTRAKTLPWEVFDTINGRPVERFATEAEAKQYVAEHDMDTAAPPDRHMMALDYDKTGTPNIGGEKPAMSQMDMHYVELPDALRSKLRKQGMPLFQLAVPAAGAAAAAAATATQQSDSRATEHDPITKSFLSGKMRGPQ